MLTDLGRGVYILWLYLPKRQTIKVGALGQYEFAAGYYAYAGSAQSGLTQRLRRHVRQNKPLRWHIDYLRQYADVVSVMVATADRSGECILAAALANSAGAQVPVPRFGASDCRCKAHLFHFSEPPAAIDAPDSFLPGLHTIATQALA